MLPLPPDVLAMLPVTVELVKLWDDHPNTTLSGEYKLHQVYSRLIKVFPATRKHEISLAIAAAVWSQR